MKSSSKKNSVSPDVYSDVTETFRVWLLLDQTKSAVSKLRDRELAKINMTPEQTAVLAILTKRNGISSISEIADIWLRELHSISTLTSRMEKKGLVKKIKYPGQKEVEIRITKKGEDLAKLIPRESIDELFSMLSPNDIQQLSNYLTLLLIKARRSLGLGINLPVIR